MATATECRGCGTALPAAARFCPACGAAARSVVATAEARKLVTVVFCDLVGSTALSGVLDPETLRSVMLRYFAALRAPIEAHGGTVEKFIGDAVMAVFGVPVMHEDDARRAAAAALGMLGAIVELNGELRPALDVALRVRIGVHTGPAVTTSDALAGQALVSGETVNIAARLEQHASAGEILIGPLTRESLGAAALVESAGALALKGKAEPVTAYRLLGVGGDDPDLLRRFDRPFVARHAELATLTAALTGGPRLVTLCGEPGIGKTRLVRVWLDRADSRPAHGSGRCRPYGDHGSLAPLADAVRPLLVGAEPGELMVLDEGLLHDGTPGPSLEATYAALARILIAQAARRPVVVVIDDCHWAADPLLDALNRLATLVAGSQVLFVCLARLDLLERRPGWNPTLALRGLSEPDCELLLASLVEVSAHAAPLLAAAGGNPFYLEQLAAGPGDPSGQPPPNLLALLGARIDALAPAERTLLELAAVIGREFTAEHLAALGAAEGPPAAGPVGPVLERLQACRLIEPGGGSLLRFANTLVREATYDTMAKRIRAARHARAADVLAAASEPGTVIAGHLERSYRYRQELGTLDDGADVLRLRAAGLLAAAGANALMRSDVAWSETLLARAAALLTTADPGWATATRRLGEARAALGRRDDGEALFAAVLAGADDPAERAHARLALDPSAAADVLPVFESAGDELGQARARIRLAQDRQLHGRHGAATELLAGALAQAVRSGAEQERAIALGAVGVSLWRGSVPVPLAVTRCLALLAEHAGPRPIVQATLSCPLAILLALDDQPAEARERITAARRIAADLDFAEAAVVLPLFAGAVEALAGRSLAALDLLATAEQCARSLGVDQLHGAAVRDAARIQLDLGKTDEAARLLSRGSAAAGAADRADAAGLHARLAAANGDAVAATTLAGEAVTEASGTDSLVLRATAELDRALVARQLGRLAAAAAGAERARKLFAAKGHRPGARRAAALVGRR